MKSLITSACCALLWVASSAAAAPGYTLSGLEGPAGAPGGVLQLGGFNNTGQLAGTWLTADNQAVPYLYTPGSGFASLLPAGAAPSGFYGASVNDLDNNGRAVGQYLGRAWSFEPSGGAAVPGTAAQSNAIALNDAGQVIGWSGDTRYVYTPGAGLATLPGDTWAMDINNTGQALLGQGTGPLSSLSRYDIATGAITPVPLDPLRELAAIGRLNDRGDVLASLGTRLNLGAEIHHADGTFTRLPDLAGAGSSEQAYDINNLGQVVGRSLRDGPIPYEPRLFLYTPGEGMVDLIALIEPSTLEGWDSLYPLFINDGGDVAGLGLHNGSFQVFVMQALAAPVPEPGAALLAGLGLAGVVIGARRRQASAASRRRANQTDCPVL
jgi:probable HAF family extracellular repeat protein